MHDKPMVFLSYARDDDRYSDKKITEFSKRLSDAYSAITGCDVQVFLDNESIKWGQHWPDTLDQALDSAAFIVPFLSPRFFSSIYCRYELKQFINFEKSARKYDLILPIYWINYDFVRGTYKKAGDDEKEFLNIICKRQYRDWREFRLRDFSEISIKEEFESMATEINHLLIQRMSGRAAEQANYDEIFLKCGGKRWGAKQSMLKNIIVGVGAERPVKPTLGHVIFAMLAKNPAAKSMLSECITNQIRVSLNEKGKNNINKEIVPEKILELVAGVGTAVLFILFIVFIAFTS